MQNHHHPKPSLQHLQQEHHEPSSLYNSCSSLKNEEKEQCKCNGKDHLHTQCSETPHPQEAASTITTCHQNCKNGHSCHQHSHSEHHQNSLFIISSSSSKPSSHPFSSSSTCSISCQCSNCKGSSSSISSSIVVVQQPQHENHHVHDQQCGCNQCESTTTSNSKTKNDQLTPNNLINLLTSVNNTTSSCSCSDHHCASTETSCMSEKLQTPRVSSNTLDSSTANYFKIVFGKSLKKALSVESSHVNNNSNVTKSCGSCGCSSSKGTAVEGSDEMVCTCDPDQPCPVRDAIALKREKSSCGGDCGGCNYSLGQSARAAAVVAIVSNLPSRSAQGKCESSVKIQKQSIMQSKLKKHLTRLRATTSDAMPPQCL
ncbi:hypothetical protein C9374_011159 [Naegleria lovaniensis]|uniref:Uncharacterized protein n=1 Tax=Naegleria lovaniensis TaxID=51637 RepID=A0AA88GEP3_NAELO|nr:uncharacterized protein C9374_011159 [Naegleria lovaniensis]KAG2374080.1 hypothetical protein C9374_011159 [Naegleria lovaniensis]